MIGCRGATSSDARTAERGSNLVGFALLLPLLLLLIFGIVEFGRLLSARETVNQAARNAARFGSANATTVNGVAQYVDCVLIRQAGTDTGGVVAVLPADITVEYDSGPGTGVDATCPEGGPGPDQALIANGDRIVVTVSSDLDLITPLVGRLWSGGKVTLSSTDRRAIFK